jgi:hypothetical protein
MPEETKGLEFRREGINYYFGFIGWTYRWSFS